MTLNEAQLVEQCKQGNRKAQREVFDRWSPAVLATIMRYVPRDDVARDILQEVMFKALTTISGFSWKGQGSLAAWIRRIAINTALNYMRDHRHELAAAPLDEAMALPGDDETDLDEDDVRQLGYDTIMQCVESLPLGYRTVFNMFCIDGFTHKQIAERLGINEKTSSSQLARAKALLAKKLNDIIKGKANGR